MMTEEELEKEAEEWLSKNWTPYDFYDTECNVYNDDIKDDLIEAYLAGTEPREKRIAELEAQIEKMKNCLNKWYNQHNDDDYTETFYDNLLRDTEKCLWGDSVND